MRTLYRGAALADGRGPDLRLGVSALIEDGRIAWIAPDEHELAGRAARRALDVEVVDASGTTIVPGLVDCHSHVTGPGGAHWTERFADPPTTLVAVAEANGRLASQAGVRWLRDVGSPIGEDPSDGRRRALALGVRDRWRARPEMPYLRAAGSWLMRRGTLPGVPTEEADDADDLLAAALRQLDDGADLLKLYLDGPDRDVAPWTAGEVERVVAATHARGIRVTAHAGRLSGARAAVAGGVDSIEHGFELDADLVGEMAGRGTHLVSTLAVMRSWRTFARTTDIERFTSADGRRLISEREETAKASVELAHRAGVAIATGTDFGGGSLRANQLAWEFEALVEAGLEPWEALGAATWRGGQLLGEPEAGVIHEGGPADFILVHGDPLSDPA
ncbi:MAG: amidohydrolase family protein, partial [Candidatus Limnocylindrales bacterium]